MSKTLYTLCVTFEGESSPLHFETYEGLLTARGLLHDAQIPGLKMDEDPATRILFVTPDKAVDYVRLWVSSLGVTEPAAHPRSVAGEEVLPSGLTHKEETLHMLLRPGGVTLEQLITRFGFEKRDSASALISTTCSKFGYTSHRSDDGVYTATKGRADGRGMEKPKTKAPEVHVLGRGRRVVESRAH